MVDGDLTEISASDPNRELNKMHLFVSSRIEKQSDGFVAVWNEGEKVSQISMDLPQGVYAGKSVTIDCR